MPDAFVSPTPFACHGCGAPTLLPPMRCRWAAGMYLPSCCYGCAVYRPHRWHRLPVAAAPSTIAAALVDHGDPLARASLAQEAYIEVLARQGVDHREVVGSDGDGGH